MPSGQVPSLRGRRGRGPTGAGWGRAGQTQRVQIKFGARLVQGPQGPELAGWSYSRLLPPR